MNIEKLNLNLLYFSATDTTAKVIKSIANGFNVNAIEYNITMPENRIKNLNFNEDDLVIIGVPVYAGRVPEFLSNYFISKIHGNNTYAVFIVVYGNRAYEDALLELKDIFDKCIRCCSCIKKCPVNAKDISYDLHKKFLIEFINKYSSVRQEPELFI